MFGYEQAAQEYENKLTAPYDKGGELYDYEEEERQRIEYLESQAEMMMEEMYLNEH